MEEAVINNKINQRLAYSHKRHIDKRERMIYFQQGSRFLRARTRKEKWGIVERHLADLLSLSRIFLALYLVWTGLVDGKANLVQDVWIMVLAWTTDIIDGRVARALTPGRQSWLGTHDVYIDMFFSIAALAFLMLTGLLPLGFGLVYLLVWLAVMARWGLPPMLAQFFQNPIYAAFLYFTVQAAPQMVPWLLLWALIAGILFGSRMLELLQGVWAVFLRWLRRR